MANFPVETVTTAADKLKLSLGVLLAVVGIAMFYLLADQGMYLRIAALMMGMAAGLGIALFSAPGRDLIAFGKDSYREVRKVVWPSRKEAGQTTLIVFGFVLVMAVYLWISDKAIEWAVFSLILAWK